MSEKNKILLKKIYRVNKKPEFEQFFHVFSIRNFFLKMTLLGLILCEESIVAFPKFENASLTLIQENECFVSKNCLVFCLKIIGTYAL
jgi:hypothetical protein